MSGYPTCSTCEWFMETVYPPDEYDLGLSDEFTTKEVPGRWGYCRLASASDGRPSERVENRRMVAHDGSGYAAGLTVRSDFGCIDHQEDDR